MTRDATPSNLDERLAELHRQVIAHLPDGSVTFVHERSEFVGGVESVFRLEPKRLGASPIAVGYVEGDNQVAVEIGRDTLIELFRASDDADAIGVLARLEAILSAVVRCGFSESVWVSGGEIVRSEAEIPLADGKPLRPKARHFGRGSLRPSKKEQRQYLPFQ